MVDERTPPPPQRESVFARTVATKAARKAKAVRAGRSGVWFGLGMSGLVGWSVAVPTIVGGMVGLWWDRHHPGARSWTLMLLVIGLALGCANAWHWIAQQDKALRDDLEDPGE